VLEFSTCPARICGEGGQYVQHLKPKHLSTSTFPVWWGAIFSADAMSLLLLGEICNMYPEMK
jgi:hypothetical protein